MMTTVLSNQCDQSNVGSSSMFCVCFVNYVTMSMNPLIHNPELNYNVTSSSDLCSLVKRQRPIKRWCMVLDGWTKETSFRFDV